MALSLELCRLAKTHCGKTADETVHVFDDINCHIKKGEFLSVVGPSGCGKTALLRIIAGLESPSAGEVLLDGCPIKGRDKRVGLVFQEYALFPWRTAMQNIETGPEFAGASKEKRRKAALKYIQAFGLSGFESKYPKALSGGMKQRVAIARTLITNPEAVLMDEPFGSLDSQTRNALQEFLLTVWTERRDTILFVTHNVDEAVYLSDRILVLSKRPAKIIRTFEINSPHPRDRTSRESNRIKREILGLMAHDEFTANKYSF